MRLKFASSVIAALLLSFLAAPALQAAERLQFDLPPQALLDSLRAVGERTGTNVLASSPAITGLAAPALRGQMTVDEAFTRLLVGTGLKHEFLDEKTVTFVPVTRVVELTQVETPRGASNPSSEPKDEQKSSTVQEIVVTAQKRAERLQDVPVPMTAINTEALTRNNQLRLQDYYKKVPGLNLVLSGNGSSPQVAIRGLVTGGQTNSTVGIVVDDVPYGATVSPGVTPSAPDIDPGDLARIEVLRGPQGTLYGASSLGGLLKFVTVDPSTQGMSGRLQAGAVDVSEGEQGFTFRGSVNLPLSETFALRASGFKIRDPGYVDNVRNGQTDINRRDSDGGRITALWRPRDDFSIKFTALMQDSERQGASDIDRAQGGGLLQSAVPGTGLYQRKTEAYSATVAGQIGDVELTSVTGYSVDRHRSRLDVTNTVGGLAASNFGVSGAAGPLQQKTEKFTQELRASLPLGERVDWLLGAFYTREDVLTHTDYFASNPNSGAVAGGLLTIDAPSTLDEYAVFTNMTFDITDRADVQFGGRYSRNKQDFSTARSGPASTVFYGANPSIVPETSSEDNVFTFLVTPRFKVSPNLMAYARLASGYRPGGANANCSGAIPCRYDPDTTLNYELGFKGNVLDQMFSFEGSLFYIDWKDIQIALTDRVTAVAYAANVGDGKSQGVELSAEAKPLSGLTLSSWVVWNDAELTNDLPPTASNISGHPGDRLPYSSRFSANFSIEQRFPLGNTLTGFAGGSLSYVGKRMGVFRAATAQRETYGSYKQVDLQAGVAYESWSLDAYVNNAGDTRGILRSGLDSLRPTYVTYIQPRTIGMSLTKTF